MRTDKLYSNRYFLSLRMFVFFACSLFFAISAYAESTSMYTDSLNPLTDERDLTLSLVFDNPREMGVYTVSLNCHEGSPAMLVMSGLVLNIDSTIPVTYRFDKDPAVTERFRWISGSYGAVKTDVQDFLDKALASEKLLVKMDSETLMRFDLKETRDKFQKFDRECKDWNSDASTK